MTSPTLATIIAGVVLWYRRYHGKHMRILLWLTLWFPPQLSNHSQVKCFQLCICAQIHINVLYSSTLKGIWNRTGYIKVFTVWLINAEDLSNWQFNDLCYRHTTFSVFQTWIKKNVNYHCLNICFSQHNRVIVAVKIFLLKMPTGYNVSH